MSKFRLVLLFVLITLRASAQILPPEGSSLNYRLVGFSFPKEMNATNYLIEIAMGDFKRIDSFKNHIVSSVNTKETRLIKEVPDFGLEYTWRVVATIGTKKKESPLYHFETRANDRVDTNKYRLRIMQPTNDYKDMYISIDGGGVIYDFDGKAMAYLPEVNGLAGFVADWKFTGEGTMTFNFGKDNYETNLNGDIIWKTPETNSVNTGIMAEKYHHAFFKCGNGHYMALGTEFKPSKVVTVNDSSSTVLSNEKFIPNGYKLGVYSSIIEFDKEGKVVWSWKDSERLLGTDFDYFTSVVDSNWRFDPHANSLFFDEVNDKVYMSYRNLSRVIKIDHKTGEIVAHYGERFKPGVVSKGVGFFCNPHGVRRSPDGYLYYFNNNSCRNTDSLPTVVMLKEPVGKSDSLEKVWEYKCTVEGDYMKRFSGGGSVVQMADGNMFVSMGNSFSKIFIVTPRKKVLWSSITERHVETDNVWVNVKQYKANYLNRKTLEELVWEAEKNIKIKN